MVSIPDHILEKSIVEPTKQEAERIRTLLEPHFPKQIKFGRKPKLLKKGLAKAYVPDIY